MKGVVDLLKAIYHRNKLFFVIALIAILIFVVGCSAEGGAPPPSGPIGGGC
jgi:hypothetical protein